MKVINEAEALAAVRRAHSGGIPTPDGLISRIFNGAIPAAKKFAEEIGGDPEMALFVTEKHCWLFGNRMCYFIRRGIGTLVEYCETIARLSGTAEFQALEAQLESSDDRYYREQWRPAAQILQEPADIAREDS